MKTKKFTSPFPSFRMLALFLGLCAGSVHAQFKSDAKITFKGAGWVKGGRIMHATDTALGGWEADYNGNIMEETGALFNSIIGFSPEIEGSFGIGVITNHKPQGKVSQANEVAIGTNSFVNMARLTYIMGGDAKTTMLLVNTGLFSYKYDQNIKNLGRYLLRGPVYPGILTSGFETKEMLPSANWLGGHVQSHFGPYTQDILLVSETDLYPKMDYSLLYIGTYQPVPWFDMSAGVNFYHYLPVRPGLTSPSAEDGFFVNDSVVSTVNNFSTPDSLVKIEPFRANYALWDSTTGDTIWFTHKGIKVMGRFALDIKGMLGLEDIGFGKSDLILYSEAAIIGVKNYPVAYDNIMERIPVMVGFNIPTFNLLSVLSIEGEYYASPLVPDLEKVMVSGSAIPQNPYKFRNPGDAPFNGRRDNWKWSVYFAKVVAGHVKFSGQVANDHMTTGGNGRFGTFEQPLTTPSDWYWMLKTTFFF